MTAPAPLKGVHHVAYRCKDAKETVEFYNKVLGMDFQLAIAEDKVPSTGAPDPYMHVFLDAGNGNVLAFFELPQQPEMGRDKNTPDWVQHIAFRVGSSTTTGKENTVVWSIHQKTRYNGGEGHHGWPDPGYVDRLTSECAANNVSVD